MLDSTSLLLGGLDRTEVVMEGRYRQQAKPGWPAPNAPVHPNPIGRRGGTQLHLCLINLFDLIYLSNQLIFVKLRSITILFVEKAKQHSGKHFRPCFLHWSFHSSSQPWQPSVRPIMYHRVKIFSPSSPFTFPPGYY